MRPADAPLDLPHRLPVHVWCKSCRHAKDADLAALIAAGRGDVPLVQMKWRCGDCGSRLTEFIVGGSHMRPRGTRHGQADPHLHRTRDGTLIRFWRRPG